MLLQDYLPANDDAHDDDFSHYNSDNDGDDNDYNVDNDDVTKLIACLCLRSTDNRSALGERLSCSSSAGGRDMLPRWNLAMQAGNSKSDLWG